MDYGTILGFGGAMFGSNVALRVVDGWFMRKKTQQEADKVETDAASVLMESVLKWQSTLTERINSLEAGLAECHTEHAAKDAIITDLKVRVAHLEAQKVST